MQPFPMYYYQFYSCDGSVSSVVGRTKTSPRYDDEIVGDIKLAVYSCSNYRNSPYHRSLIVSSRFLQSVWGPRETGFR